MSGDLKGLPIGTENFAKLRDWDCYYVDKTRMIGDLLKSKGSVTLFTRPRRFGKTLNMSMLKTFFEIGCDRSLFDGLWISEQTELCDRYMGKFPVISLSLKDIEAAEFKTARNQLCSCIGDELSKFSDILTKSPKLNETDKKSYMRITDIADSGESMFSMPDVVLSKSIKTVSELLEKHCGQKTIILIDEYDVPLAKADERGYYDEMITLIRGILGNALKTNDSLYFAVLTGCLRVSKESVFTGLNNLKVYTASDSRFSDCFGFTDGEVRELLDYYGLGGKYGAMKEWYDGYRFGDTEVYCPWDVINYCSDLLDKPNAKPKNYWSNTSGNDAIRRFINTMGAGTTRGEIESLIAGEPVVKDIREDLTYGDLYSSADNLWSLLYAAGYLTLRGDPDESYELAVPNLEIRSIFTNQLLAMFKEKVPEDGELLREFCAALEDGDAPEVERLFSKYLAKTMGIRDTFARRPAKENFYHGILLGILGYKGNWYVKSNKEAGEGYSDIMILLDDEDKGIVIEVKYAEQRDRESVCRRALEQIEERDYVRELRERGCVEIIKYGIACCRRGCRVMAAKEENPIEPRCYYSQP